MPDVAGTPLRTAVEVAIRDDPGPDPGPDLDDDHVVVARGDPRVPLPERQDIDVVVDPDGCPVAIGESIADRIAVPAGHDRWRDGPAGLEFDRAGHADPDPPQRSRQLRDIAQQRFEQEIDPIEADLRTRLDPGRLVVMPEDPPVEGRDRDVDARGAQVGDQQMAAIGSEGQLARRAAARTRTNVALGQQSARDQVADPLRDDRPAEPRAGHEFRA